MKRKFSTAWKASSQPRKQRKYTANAPLHIKRKYLSVNLSKELRKKSGKRNTVVRKGDTVKIMRGKFGKKQGKVVKILTKLCKVYVEKIQNKKLDGSNVDVPLKPSNLQLMELNLEDKKRIKKLGISGKTNKKPEEKKQETNKKENSPENKKQETKSK